MANIQLLVGFGGSGGKTLATLAEYIADDALLADRGGREFFFLLVDTDQADMDRAAAGIRDQFKRAGGSKVHVEVLVLSKGTGRVLDLIGDAMGRDVEAEIGTKQKSPALEVLRKHWPFDPKGVPFSAPRLPVPLTKGASQCPLGAHLAAWDALDRGTMQTAFENIRTAMINRLHESDDQQQIDLLMVGSLAGGTGRGCWTILSLYARSIFKRCKPHAYFFDSSVFKDLPVSGREKYRMHVNSLTGLSEIAGWLRNDLKPKTDVPAQMHRFFLPKLRGAADGFPILDTDTIAHSTLQPHFVGRSPVDGVFIITGSSDAVAVTGPSDAYDIAAAALFARVAVSGIESKMANDLHIGSCGAAIAKVPITAIANCVKLRAQLELVNGVTNPDETKSQHSAARIGLPITFRAEELVDLAQSGSESFVGKICSHFNEVDTSQLTNAFKANKRTEDILKVLDGMGCMTADRAVAKEAVDKATVAVLNVPQAKDSANAMRAAVERELKILIEHKVSAGTLKEMLGRVRKHLEQLQKHLPSLATIEFSRDSAMKSLMGELKSREGREFTIFGDRWSDQEQTDICARVVAASQSIHQKVIIEVLHDALRAWIGIVMEYAGVVEPPVAAAERIRAETRDLYEKEVRSLFLPSDMAGTLDAFGDWTSKRAKAKRILRPAFSDDTLRDLVAGIAKGESNRVVEEGMAKFRQALNDRLWKADAREAMSNEEKSGKELREQDAFLQTNVFKGLSVPVKVLKSHFNVSAVLKGIEKHVRHLLDTNQGDAHGCEQLQDAFEAMFGVRFVFSRRIGSGAEESHYAEIRTAVLVQQLGYSLAQLADPMFRIDRQRIPAAARGEVDLDHATTYFPMDTGEGVVEFIEGARSAMNLPAGTARQLSHRTTVEKYAAELCDSLPYCILAHSTYTIPGFEKLGWDPVKSFDFWRDDSAVLKWLSRCETVTQDGVWEVEDGNFGLGYMHPSFVSAPWAEVRDSEGKHASGLRWAPWGLTAETHRKRSDELDALLYALAGNFSSSENKNKEGAAEIIGMVSQHEPSAGTGEQWTMPLLRRGDGEDVNVWVLHRKTFQVEAGHVGATGGNWGSSKKFNTLQEFIRWIGGPDMSTLTTEGRAFIAAVNAERRLIPSQVLMAIGDAYGEVRRAAVNRELMGFIDEYSEDYLKGKTEEQKNREVPLLKALRSRISNEQWSWDRPPSI